MPSASFAQRLPFCHRVYERDRWGAPIWRKHWVPSVVVGETTRSWVLKNRSKVPKRGAPWVAFSEADIDRAEWVHENRHAIARRLEQCRDYDTWREVARLVKYEPAP